MVLFFVFVANVCPYVEFILIVNGDKVDVSCYASLC